MNLREQRAAALKAAQDIISKAKGEDRAMSDDERSEVETKRNEIAELDTKMQAASESDNLMAKIANLGGSEPDTDTGKRPAKSLGDHYVKHAGNRLLESKGSRFSVVAPEYKSNSDSHVSGDVDSSATTAVDRTVVEAPRRDLTIADLLGSGSMGSGNTSLTYFVEDDVEGSVATVTEGSKKSQLHYTYSHRTDALSKLAGFVKLSDEMVEDLDFIVSEINNRLLYDLAKEEEDQLINGDGSSPNLEGILKRSGIQSEDNSDGDSSDDLDSVFKAITKVRKNAKMEADGIVIHPSDYQTFRLSKDGNEQYFGGGPFVGAYGNSGDVPIEPGLWGRRTVITSAIDEGTVLVGNFGQGGTVYRKGGVRVESTNTNEDDFTHNMVTIRAEERIGLAVRRPLAFVEVSLASGSSE